MINFFKFIIPVFFLMSFTQENKKNLKVIYGITILDSSYLQLTINADSTFIYKDHSNRNNKIDVNGVCQFKGEKIVLVSKNNKTKFHDVWTFEKDKNAVKSRKGLCFYRLVRLN